MRRSLPGRAFPGHLLPSAGLSRGAIAALLAASIPAMPGGVHARQLVQERVDLGAAQRIREEGLTRSRVDSIAFHLTEVIGPRLTNSPGNRRALDWVAAQFRAWGLANAEVQPWDSAFGRGWEQVSYSGRIIEPYPVQLNATPQAWSGSTRGTITCNVVVLEVQDSTDLARYAGRLRGACVLRGDPGAGGPEFETFARRTPTDELLAPAPAGAGGGPSPEQMARFREAARIGALTGNFLRTQGVAAYLQPSVWSYGILRTGGHPDGRLARDSIYNPTPALVVSKEQYGLIHRLVTRGTPVKLELNIQNRFVDDDRRGANVLGEIPGTDRANEVVMLGAHLDSWHSGAGATDNAAGSSVMMEAIRILKVSGLPLRRTVRIGLWSGEEQGLLGSRAWVRMHRDQWPRISAYVNLDNGTGRIRGIWNQSNAAATPIFEQMLFPFRDLGVVAVRHGNTGGTDHLAFDAVGIPGFNFIQDPIEYSIRTHHSNADTFDHLLLDDLKQAATVVAWTVYHLANRDAMMPRKPAATP